MKNKVLIFIDWFYPAYKAGGPIKSVFNIVESLKSEIDFLIVTSNQDVDGEVIDIQPNQVIEKDGFKVVYLDVAHQKKNKYKEFFDEFNADLIYYNSIFSKNFTLKPLLYFRKKGVKQRIAPRGMLGRGALAIKPFKKKLFLKFFKRMFRKNEKLSWHASTRLEKNEIQTVFGEKSNVFVAQNLSSASLKRKLAVDFKRVDELKLVFVSRISIKKNLLFALELFQNSKTHQKLSLDIYGPIEEEVYWKKCRLIIDADPRITYKGILKPTGITSVLQQNHFFILPTQHENYGHAIAEAINAGVPVLISDNTPWSNLAAFNVGHDLPLTEIDLWKGRLETLIQLDQASYEKLVIACYEYSLDKIVSKELVQENRKLFGLD